MRDAFRVELAALEARMQEHGAIVADALEAAVETLIVHEREVVDGIVTLDLAADQRYLSVEELCVLVIARQAPVARDLRVVLGALHVNQHLKRMMRNAVRIATYAEPMSDEPIDGFLIDALHTIGTRTTAMTRNALAAFAARDLEAARTLHDDDDRVDVDLHRALERILELDHADDRSRERAMRSIFVARALERSGDHAVAIADQTAYIVTGNLRPLRSDRAERG